MPREIVQTEGPYHPKVGWQHGSYVQMGVESDDEGKSLFWSLFSGEDQKRDLSAAIQRELGVDPEKVSTVPDEDPSTVIAVRVLECLDRESSGTYRGLWATLDRHGVNRLIRLLRKARDGAFGRDE